MADSNLAAGRPMIAAPNARLVSYAGSTAMAPGYRGGTASDKMMIFKRVPRRRDSANSAVSA
jgi:hypothetical protein